MRRLVLALVLIFVLPASPAQTGDFEPTIKNRSVAVKRAYRWMVKDIQRPKMLREYGTDYLEFFYEVMSSSVDRSLARRAYRDGRALALRYQAHLLSLKELPSPQELVDAISFLALFEEFDLKANKRIFAMTHAALRRFDYKKVFEVRQGQRCRDPDALCDAVISLHFARRAGLQEGLGLKWALGEAARFKYGKAGQIDPDVALAQDNLVTHVVYVLSDYGRLRLNRRHFDPELEYIRDGYDKAIERFDIEGLSEFTDSLRILGFADSDRDIQSGMRWLLSIQNADGSFGEPDWDDYDRYHSTWTALNALRRFRFQGQGPTLKLWLELRAKEPAEQQ